MTYELSPRDIADVIRTGDHFKPLGDDCDRASWERVRLLP